MKEKVMDINLHWERIKKEQLSFFDEFNTKTPSDPTLAVGGSDIKETVLKTLVQQAARS